MGVVGRSGCSLPTGRLGDRPQGGRCGEAHRRCKSTWAAITSTAETGLRQDIHHLRGLGAGSVEIKESAKLELLRAAREGAVPGFPPWLVEDCLHMVFPRSIFVSELPLRRIPVPLDADPTTHLTSTQVPFQRCLTISK